MNNVELTDLMFKAIWGVILFAVGVVVARFTFSIGKIVRLLTEIVDRLPEPIEKPDEDEKSPE